MDTSPEHSSFVAMLAQSGMQVPSEQLPSLFEGYRHLIRLIALLGTPSTREAEPAVSFTPAQR